MGKKSRKKSSGNKTSSVAGSNIISADGRMTEKNGRRFYDLLTFLAEIAVPLLEAKRKDAQRESYIPIGWRKFNLATQDMGMAANSMEVRETVMSFILKSINLLVDEVDSHRHDDLFISIFNRKLTESDRNEIQSWKTHIQDDFFYITTRFNEGAVLVQVGSHKMVNELLKDDVHEPRVFLVQGLADPLHTLLQGPISQFRQQNLAIAMDYPNATITLINTTLLPYNGGITYMTTLKQEMHHHYKTPKDMADAARISIRAAEAAFGVDSCVALYRSLNPDTDSHICRLAERQTSLPSEMTPSSHRATAFDKRSANDDLNTTSLIVQQMYWKPFGNQNDPRMQPIMSRVCDGPKPFQLEGIKYGVTEENLIEDDDICPFHNEMALGKTPLFKDCCKKDFLRRTKKAKEKNNGAMAVIMYEPLVREEGEVVFKEMNRLGKNADDPLDVTKYLRRGYMDMGVVQFTIPKECVPKLKEILDMTPTFHTIMDHKWIYLGFVPMRMSYVGIMTFGDIEVYPETGVFEGSAMTARRLTAVIREMKFLLLCTDIPILDAKIEMQPSHKMKPNEEILKQNQEILQEGLELKISSSIDKKEHAAMRRHCTYCGNSEKDDGADLSRCPCKLVYFCSTECQRAHWPNHKKKCKIARDKMKKK